MAQNFMNQINVRLVIYKKIVEGDLRKFTATSNDTPSGGGARDLRFSPANEFFPVFNRMFPGNGNILYGQFTWGNNYTTSVEIHSPTESRPNEVRIAKINECFPQTYIPYDATDCILLLVLDNLNRVCPYFTSMNSIIHAGWHPVIRNNIINGFNATRPITTTPMGYIDIEFNRIYTNGQI